MSEQSSPPAGRTAVQGAATDGHAAVVRSLLAIADTSQLAVLTVVNTGGEPTGVRVTETIPDTHTLGLPGGGSRSAAGGVVSIEGTVGPESALRVGHVLSGPLSTALPEPAVESLPEPVSEEGIRATMRDTRGEETRLDVRTETLLGQPQLRLPLLALPGEPQTDDALLHGGATPRSMDDAAVGLVLTPTNEDAALRTVVRASQRGHSVLVTYTDDGADTEILSKLSSLSARVIEPTPQEGTQSQLHRQLSAAARERGLLGIVLQTRDCPRIDYDRTAEAYAKADYEVMAIPESWHTSSTGTRVVVGIPAYNAASSIADVVEQAATFADDVVVVDDGSHDETAARAREAGASVVVHEMNRGYGGALKTLFRRADDRGVDHLVVIDADGQHDASDIPMLVETQERDGADIVIGSRYVGERETKIPLVRSIGLAVINGLTNVSMGKLRPSGYVHDTQSGYRAYSRRAIRSLSADPMIGNNMGASTDILYHAHKARLSVSEVPTTIYYDVENASTQSSVSHGVDLLRNIAWTVEYGRPLLVVGGPGVVSTVMGITATVLLLTSYLDTGTLYAHQLLVAILFAVGGMLVCIAAMLMHVLNVHPTMRRLTADAND